MMLKSKSKDYCDKPKSVWKPIGFRPTIQELKALTFLGDIQAVTTNDVNCELVKMTKTLM